MNKSGKRHTTRTDRLKRRVAHPAHPRKVPTMYSPTLLFHVFLGWALSLSVCASTYYVDPAYQGVGTGEPGSPWSSLDHAIRHSTGGDTILLAGGHCKDPKP
jgi:hypothetical protein